jgi:hypothetical protein
MRLYEYGMQSRVDHRVERRHDRRSDRRAEPGRSERELGTPIEREQSHRSQLL